MEFHDLRGAVLLLCGFFLFVVSSWGGDPLNLIDNGDFGDGMGGWGLHRQDGADAVVAARDLEGADGKCAEILVRNGGAAGHHVQLMYRFDAGLLEAGLPYSFSFRARSTASRTARVSLMGADRPWPSAGLRENFAIETEWQQYEMVFRAADTRQPEGKVDFFLGGKPGTIWIDELSLGRHVPAEREATGPVLATDTCSLRFSREGSLARMTHSASGRVLIGGLRDLPAFELTLYRDGNEHNVSGEDAAGISAERSQNQVVFTYEFPDITVETSTALRADSVLAECRLSVTNRGPAAVTAIRYPILSCPAQLGESSTDDALLYPRCDGGLVEDPLRSMAGRGLDELYPGPLSCQLMAYYDDTAGLYIAAYDTEGHPKRLGCRVSLDMELSMTHLLPILPGKDAELGYPVVVGAFQGNWYDAAETYRDWAHTAPWCAETILERTDTPPWLEAGGGLVTMYNPRARDREGKLRFTPSGLENFLAELENSFGLPVLPNNRGWERHGSWTGQEYLPPFPDPDGFRTDASIIRRWGGWGMVMLSGYRWTIEKKRPDGTVYSSADRFEREVKPFVTREIDGHTPTVTVSQKEKDFRGTKYARLCPATRFAEKTVCDIAEYCVSSGYSIIHFDQEVSGCATTSFCRASDHGHPPGYGVWMHRSMSGLFERIREECSALDPDFALSMEEPNELYIPHLNLCQSRPNGLTDEFPLKPPLTKVVPLFSFLYHDFLVGWIAFYPWRSRGWETYSLARGFSAGMLPGLHRESMNRWPEDRRAAFRKMLRNCCTLCARPALEYFLFGRMLKPLDLDVPVRTLNLGTENRKAAVPAVSNSVWELPGGRRAVILINPEKEKHVVEIPGPDGSARPVTVPPLDAAFAELDQAQDSGLNPE